MKKFCYIFFVVAMQVLQPASINNVNCAFLKFGSFVYRATGLDVFNTFVGSEIIVHNSFVFSKMRALDLKYLFRVGRTLESETSQRVPSTMSHGTVYYNHNFEVKCSLLKDCLEHTKTSSRIELGMIYKSVLLGPAHGDLIFDLSLKKSPNIDAADAGNRVLNVQEFSYISTVFLTVGAGIQYQLDSDVYVGSGVMGGLSRSATGYECFRTFKSYYEILKSYNDLLTPNFNIMNTSLSWILEGYFNIVARISNLIYVVIEVSNKFEGYSLLHGDMITDSLLEMHSASALLSVRCGLACIY